MQSYQPFPHTTSFRPLPHRNGEDRCAPNALLVGQCNIGLTGTRKAPHHVPMRGSPVSGTTATAGAAVMTE
jgi:hypothetical protein